MTVAEPPSAADRIRRLGQANRQLSEDLERTAAQLEEARAIIADLQARRGGDSAPVPEPDRRERRQLQARIRLLQSRLDDARRVERELREQIESTRPPPPAARRGRRHDGPTAAAPTRWDQIRDFLTAHPWSPIGQVADHLGVTRAAMYELRNRYAARLLTKAGNKNRTLLALRPGASDAA